MAKEKFNGLEGKLNVSIGTLLCLVNEGDVVVGFVKCKDKKTVTLSHEKPGNNLEYNEGYTIPDNRIYNLSSFKDYYSIAL